MFFLASSDFQLAQTSIRVTTTTPANVLITFTRDNVALEPNETVRLQFIPDFTPQVGETLLDTIDVTIRDTDSKFCNIYTAMTVRHIFGHTYCRVKVLCFVYKPFISYLDTPWSQPAQLSASLLYLYYIVMAS